MHVILYHTLKHEKQYILSKKSQIIHAYSTNKGKPLFPLDISKRESYQVLFNLTKYINWTHSPLN